MRNFIAVLQFSSQNFPLPQTKIPEAKTAVDKEWENGENFGVDPDESQKKKKVIDEGRAWWKKSFCLTDGHLLMGICHLKDTELEAKHQKHKSRVARRGKNEKDYSRFYAVFTEKDFSVSQMTVVRIMDIISRLPDCDGQAADAVSAYTQVKMEDAHKLLKIPKSECPDIWIRSPRHLKKNKH